MKCIEAAENECNNRYEQGNQSNAEQNLDNRQMTTSTAKRNDLVSFHVQPLIPHSRDHWFIPFPTKGRLALSLTDRLITADSNATSGDNSYLKRALDVTSAI